MEKNRVMAAAAALAVAIATASGVARCAATNADQPQAASGATPAGTTQEARPEGDPEPSAAERLAANEWVGSKDASKRLTASGGQIVETDARNTLTSAYEVTSDSEDGCVLAVTRSDGTTVRAVVEVGGEGDSLTMHCEQLQTCFDWSSAARRGSFEVRGVDEAYLDLVDGDAEGFEDAVSGWCSSNVPGASGADFDGEVFVETKSGTVTCTVTCDDPGRTVASVTWSDGAFSIGG